MRGTTHSNMTSTPSCSAVQPEPCWTGLSCS